MLAAILHEPGPPEAFSLEEVPRPAVGADDILVKVKACGVSFRDVVERNGTYRRDVAYPLIIGLEIAGVVEAVGADVADLRPGDRVCSKAFSSCGHCRYCRTGRETTCLKRQPVRGGYAEYVALPQDAWVRFPAELAFEAACTLGPGAGVALNAVRDTAKVRLGDTVLVTGATGGVGLPTVQLAKPAGEAHTFTVAGIIAYSLPGRSADGALLISLADARELFGANSAEVWAFVKQPTFPDAAFRASLHTEAASYAAELLTAAGLSSDLERSLDRVIGLFDVLSLLAVVIAGLGIVNTLGVSVLERAREIAILRSHGMTTGQVQAMVVAEASIMGAIGGLAAIVTGLLMSWAVVGGTASRDFGAGLAIPWPLLISVLLLGTGVAALAGLYPARLAARIPIVRTIAHHE